MGDAEQFQQGRRVEAAKIRTGADQAKGRQGHEGLPGNTAPRIGATTGDDAKLAQQLATGRAALKNVTS
jgi:hypothetical protein